MDKFHFSILARNRLRINSIAIMGKDREDAERKLRQMYRYCEVLSCETRAAPTKPVPPCKQIDATGMSAEPFLTLLSA